MWHRSNRPLLFGLSLSLVLGTVLSGQGRDRAEPRLESLYDVWLERVEPWIGDDERRVFIDLHDDLLREHFIRGFWQARPTHEQSRFLANLEASQQQRSLAPIHRRVVQLAGKPSRVFFWPGCEDLIRPLEVWLFDRWSQSHQTGHPAASDLTLVFVRRTNLDARSWTLWSRVEGVDALYFGRPPSSTSEALLEQALERRCIDSRDGGFLQTALLEALPYSALLDRLKPPSADSRWLADIARVREQPSPLSHTSVEWKVLGREGQSTVLRGTLLTDASVVPRLAEGHLFGEIKTTGDLYRNGRLADSFEIVHHVAGAVPADGQIHLPFYRSLYPGEYRLELRVADHNDVALLRQHLVLEVTETENRAQPPRNHRDFIALTRPDVVSFVTFTSVEILPVPASFQTEVAVDVVVTGGPIHAVDIRLDDDRVALDATPPYRALVPIRRDRQKLVAIAVDSDGSEIARDSQIIERPSLPFAIHLSRSGDDTIPDGEDSARPVVVAVQLPQGEQLSRVDCYWNDKLAQSHPAPLLDDGSLLCPLPTHDLAEPAYIRAVATLENGESVEDVLFLTIEPEEVEVRLAELYVTVRDHNGRAITHLGRDDFEIKEEGVARPVRQFSSLKTLPINVALLMDLSSSMRTRVRSIAASASRFFDNTLKARDVASLTVFNHDIDPLVPFTGDVRWLQYATRGLRAHGSTRLHDSLVLTLLSFAGLENRRAMVVLSDGADVGSDFTFEQALDLAVRSSVVVYPIALGPTDEQTRSQLEELARSTGGRFFLLGRASQLDDAYERIEEDLRAQYLLAYRPGSDSIDLTSHRLDVEVLIPGLEVSHVHSRYP